MLPTADPFWLKLKSVFFTIALLSLVVLGLVLFFYIAFWGLIIGAIVYAAFYVKNRWFAKPSPGGQAFNNAHWRQPPPKNQKQNQSGNVYEHGE